MSHLSASTFYLPQHEVNLVSVTCFVFDLQREGELLLLLSTLLPQLQFVSSDPFLQPTLLQSCIGCLLALLEAGARSGHLPYSSQVIANSMPRSVTAPELCLNAQDQQQLLS